MSQSHLCATCKYNELSGAADPCNSCAHILKGTEDHWTPINMTATQVTENIQRLETENRQLQSDNASLRVVIKFWKDMHDELWEKHKKTEIEMEEAKKRYDECMEIYKNHADANNADGLKTLLEAYRTVLKDVLSVDAAR